LLINPRIKTSVACEIVSTSASALVQQIYERIRADPAIAGKRERLQCRPEVQRAIATIIEQTLKCRREGAGSEWTKIAISQIRASRFGVDAGVFRNLLGALDRAGLIERLVGYPANLSLPAPAARSGRIVRIKAGGPLLVLCARFGVFEANLAAHFRPAEGR
jgi:hypothetical protein